MTIRAQVITVGFCHRGSEHNHSNLSLFYVLTALALAITEQVVLPEGLHLEFIPRSSPELQPAQRLWSLTNESIANRSFKALDQLEEMVFHRCRNLLNQRELIRGLTYFHWWPKVAA